MYYHWRIGDVKKSARRYVSGSYWKSVLVALVLAIVGIGANTSFSGVNGGETIFEAIGSAWSGGPHHFFFSWGWPWFWEGGRSGSSFGSGWSGSHPGFGHFYWDGFGGMLFGVAFVVILCCVVGLAGIAIRIFLCNPIEAGCERFYVVNHVQPGRTSLGEMFHSFDGKYYLNVVKTLFLRDLYLFLWSLLFIIPGIIKNYSYRLVPYILAEQPDMDQREAFRLSMEMMDGNKWDAFCLDLSFIGWDILNMFTLGILGIFYVTPYHTTANAEMYIAIRDEYFQKINQAA